MGHIGLLQVWFEGSVPALGDWLRQQAASIRLFGYGAAASVRSRACGGGSSDAPAETRNKMGASQTETRRLGQRICRWHPDLRIIRGGARRDLAGSGPDARGRNRLDAGAVPSPHAPARPSTHPVPSISPFLLLSHPLTHSAYPEGRHLSPAAATPAATQEPRVKWRRRTTITVALDFGRIGP